MVYLAQDIAEIILEYTASTQDRVRASQVSITWRDAFKRVGLKGNMVTLPSMSEFKFDAFIRSHGNKITHIDLTQCTTLPNKALEELPQLLPNLEDIRLSFPAGNPVLWRKLFVMPTLKTVEMLNSERLSTLSAPPNKINTDAEHELALVRLHFWQCRTLKVPTLKKLIQPSLQSLGLSSGPHIDSSLLQHLLNTRPTLRSLTLIDCALNRALLLHTFLSDQANSLEVLNLCDTIGVSTLGISPFPVLRKLVLDGTNVTNAGVAQVLLAAPKLQTLSLRNCRQINDSTFTNILQSAAAKSLRSIFLNGCGVSDETVVSLRAACPCIRELVVDSCRGVSRDLRLEMGKRYPAVSADRLLELSVRGSLLGQYGLPSFGEMENDLASAAGIDLQGINKKGKNKAKKIVKTKSVVKKSVVKKKVVQAKKKQSPSVKSRLAELNRDVNAAKTQTTTRRKRSMDVQKAGAKYGSSRSSSAKEQEESSSKRAKKKRVTFVNANDRIGASSLGHVEVIEEEDSDYAQNEEENDDDEDEDDDGDYDDDE